MSSQHDAAAVRIFPPLVPLATILTGIGLNHLWPLDPGVTINAPERFWVGGLVIAFSVLGLGLWSVLIMRRTGQSENPWKPTTQVVESGPFRFTRNPMYLQMVIVCIGMFVLLSNFWILLLTPACAWALYRFAVLPEERYLERKFGQSYEDYKRRVRRWL
jgi:protein-S-isoprenylcysteine O-methyltransferase Ste14